MTPNYRDRPNLRLGAEKSPLTALGGSCDVRLGGVRGEERSSGVYGCSALTMPVYFSSVLDSQP